MSDILIPMYNYNLKRKRNKSQSNYILNNILIEYSFSYRDQKSIYGIHGNDIKRRGITPHQIINWVNYFLIFIS